ncbi:MAG: transposase [bacterium]|nr:transposase [bacterium]
MSERPFNADEPIAFFLTWTTYGTWLPGDERGSWHQGDFQEPNLLFRQMAAAEMKETSFLASFHDREIIHRTICRHCAIRNWDLHAVHARSNHVHVVVSAPGYKAETVRDQFKAWCTRKLKLAHPNRQRFWTEGGSCRSINHESDLETAVRYTNEAQDMEK